MIGQPPGGRDGGVEAADQPGREYRLGTIGSLEAPDEVRATDLVWAAVSMARVTQRRSPAGACIADGCRRPTAGITALGFNSMSVGHELAFVEAASGVPASLRILDTRHAVGAFDALAQQGWGVRGLTPIMERTESEVASVVDARLAGCGRRELRRAEDRRRRDERAAAGC